MKTTMLWSLLLSVCILSCTKKTHLSPTAKQSMETVSAKPGETSKPSRNGEIGIGDPVGEDPGKPDPENPGDPGNPPQPSDPNCADAICTQVFEQIFLKVHDASGNVVMLDNFYSEDMSGARLPASLNEYDDYRKAYVVCNDSWVLPHQNTTAKIRFLGFAGGVKVVDEVYDISADCCHISKSSGKDLVVVP